MADQTDRLILQTESAEENARRLAAELARTEDAMSALQNSFQAGAISFNQFDQRLDSLSAHAQKLRGSLASVQSGTAQTSESTRALTSSFTQFAYAANDADQFNVSFSAGVRSMANQLPGLSLALGNLVSTGFAGVGTALMGPAGIILGLTVAASLVPQLVAHWGDLEEAFGLGGTKTEAQAMKELADQTERTVEQEEKLVEFRREQATLKSLQEGETRAVKEARAAATDVVQDAGFLSTAEALARARNPGGFAGNISAADRIAIEREQFLQDLPGAGGKGDDESIRKVQDDAIARARDSEIKRAEADVSKALADPARFKALLGELQRSGGPFAGLADQLAAATPESLARTKELNELGKENEATGKAKLADEDKRAKLRDALNVAGLENESENAQEKSKAYEKRRTEEEKKTAKLIEDTDKVRLGEAKGKGADLLAKAAAGTGAGAGSIAKILQRLGIDPITAQALAGEGVTDARRAALADQLAPEKRRNSEVFEAASLVDRIQGGVGGQNDVGLKQLREAQQTTMLLRQIVNRRVGQGNGVVFQ